MIIDQLTNIPSEDQLSDIVVSIFRQSPNLIPSFTKTFAGISVPESRYEDFSRKQLSAIPGIGAGSFGKLKPDIILSNQTHLLVFENKRDAVLKSSQLPDYIQGVQGLKKQKSILYFLIAPRTSRYTGLPSEFVQVTWDQFYDFLPTHDHGESEQILARFRLFFFQNIFDQVLARLRGEFSGLPYVSEVPTSDYYGIHFTLPQSEAVVFSLAIFLQSPSYLKLFPFKVSHQGKLLKFNDNHPVIQNYRTSLLKLPRTEHKLKTSLPGYVIDLFPHLGNDALSISKEVLSLFKDECQQMISLYRSR